MATDQPDATGERGGQQGPALRPIRSMHHDHQDQHHHDGQSTTGDGEYMTRASRSGASAEWKEAATRAVVVY